MASDNDPQVARMIESIKGLRDIISGRMLVQYFPILRYVPMWVPFLGSQLRELAYYRAASGEVKRIMFHKTQEDLASIIRDFNEGAHGCILINLRIVSRVGVAKIPLF